MKDINFNNMRDIEIPDSWVQKALDVPQKKHTLIVTFSQRTKLIASAACLVFVCVMVLMMSHDTPQVNIKSESTSATYATDLSEQTELTTKNHTNGTQLNTSKPYKKPSAADVTEPTEKTQMASKNTQETKESAANPTSTVRPTSAVHSEATEPTENPTTVETQKPTQKPTEKPTQKPTEKPTEKPTDDGYLGVTSVNCNAVFSRDNLAGVNKVYCKICTVDGRLLGDSNLYSNQHLAYMTELKNGMIMATYDPESFGIILQSGRYVYYFYNAYGTTISSGTITLG